MLNVTIGLVFSQVMFCDDQGKLKFHRVLTEVDKPWVSVFELLAFVQRALFMNSPSYAHSCLNTIQVRVNYKTVDFQQLLTSLQQKLVEAYIYSEIRIANESPALVQPVHPVPSAEICVDRELLPPIFDFNLSTLEVECLSRASLNLNHVRSTSMGILEQCHGATRRTEDFEQAIWPRSFERSFLWGAMARGDPSFPLKREFC